MDTTIRASKDKKGAVGHKIGGGLKKKPVSCSIKAGLQFLVGRIGRYLKKGHYTLRVGTGTSVYLAAVLEYLATKAGNTKRDNKKNRIILSRGLLATKNNKELEKLLVRVTIYAHCGILSNNNPVLLPKKTVAMVA